jgi:hypothetical protein
MTNPFLYHDSISLQFIHSREYLETHYSSLEHIQKNLNLSLADNIEEIFEITLSINELANQVALLISLLEISETIQIFNKPRANLINGLNRIYELSIATSSILEFIVDRICWSKPVENQLAQLDRNVVPMKQLLGESINWLNLLIDQSPGANRLQT